MLRKESIQFLQDVAENNNRAWFAIHKDEYEAAKQDVLNLVAKILPELAKVDPSIAADFDPKKCLMRIYRDVRFSKNKDPYKTNFGIWFSAKKSGNEPGYYLHIQPNNSFLAGGYWMPDNLHLKKIRQEIDYNAQEFNNILSQPDFKSKFSLSYNDTLKKAPKGYDPNDPNIELLKLKSFEAVEKISDKEFFNTNIVDKLVNSYQTIFPLVAFLRKAIDI